MIIAEKYTTTLSATPAIFNRSHPYDRHLCQDKLMSPPITPKLNNSNDDQLEVNEFMVLLPKATQVRSCHTTDQHSLGTSSSRKSSLSQSIHAMTLANHDTLDTVGRRFSLPFDKQQEQATSCRPHRTKSLPRRSPTCSRGVFTMNVFDRPRIEATVGLAKKGQRQRSSAVSDKPTLHMDNKARVDTFFYDHVDLSVQDYDIYSPEWVPLWEPLDKRPSIRVVWKGSPLCIHTLPYHDSLHPSERNIASTLRLTPEQYLKCKRAMILTAKVFYQHGQPFRKSDAQKVCRIDVNKTSSLWGAFNRLGWLHPRSL